MAEFFAHHTTVTPRFAWETFGENNGTATYFEFVNRIKGYSERQIDPDLTLIGSTVLVEPFFLPEELSDSTAVRLGFEPHTR